MPGELPCGVQPRPLRLPPPPPSPRWAPWWAGAAGLLPPLPAGHRWPLPATVPARSHCSRAGVVLTGRGWAGGCAAVRGCVGLGRGGDAHGWRGRWSLKPSLGRRWEANASWQTEVPGVAGFPSPLPAAGMRPLRGCLLVHLSLFFNFLYYYYNFSIIIISFIIL